MKKLVSLLLMIAVIISAVAAADPVKIDALILPKFENGEMSGDFPGEAQYYHEAYTEGGDVYDIPGAPAGHQLYVKDGIALFVTGMGKVNTAVSLTSLLTDDRFDFSDAYFLATGCAGSSTEYTVMGDVFIITATIDYDLGHHADPREMTSGAVETWFHDASYDDASFKLLNQELAETVYQMTKDADVRTTEKTAAFMAAAFPGEEWAQREPMVLKGTTVTADNYWKGYYDEANARLMTETYGAPDPYALSEMEDNAIAVTLDRFGLLDQLIIIRDSVNMDVFMLGATPESLWDPNFQDSLSSEDSVEAADIFATAMENNFKVGSIVIDAIKAGTL